MSESVDELKAKVEELEKELQTYKELSAHLAKENAEITDVVKSYLAVIERILPERKILVAD